MKRCGPAGRDCIEEKSTLTFNCSVACEGIHADVHWANEIIEEEVEDQLVEDEMDVMLFNKENSADLELMYKEVTNMKLMCKSLQKEMDLLKENKRGKEVDREKYIKLISEFKSFKKNNVRNFRFNPASNMTQYGKFHRYLCDLNFETRGRIALNSSVGADLF